ncbi:Nuclear aminoacylation-dependent tRNA export pathway component [Coemansia asiatica]|uniref:Nuclear aminoacylation-dependent tRNA export pathway component n=1 Tax=Coemansia asiatica TaxID=1052880 RepID=A0A9W7XPC7_9FUNG|nr:Nuclear aminoacylation-dependent tRNA export pathway component [Coemansia asiatica]
MSGLSSYLFSTLSKVGGIGGSGIPDFHYTIGAPVDAYSGQSIWQLHHGQKTDSSKQAASVFVFDKSRGSSFTTAAQNALKRMRTLRHPGILRYMEGAETADAIYIATEPVTPLSLVAGSDDSDEELRRWGLYKIAETLKFLSVDCKMVHANLCAATVFVTKAGEWRLGGLELVDALTGDGQQIYRNFTGVVPGYAARMAPEFETRKWDAVEAAKPGAVDGWSLACLIYEVFNGSLQNASQMDVHGRIPQNLWPLYQRLHQPDIRRRMTPGDFLQTASRPGAYLDSEFVHASLFLENIAVKEQEEKSKFFAGLHTLIGGFPQTFSKYKILPELLKVMEFGGGDAKVLSGIIHIGKGLDETEYAELVVPSIVQLFGSNDRALRFSLLEHMDSFIPSVPASVVGKQVFPNFIAGYLDAAPAIREATVKASLVVAPKISSKVLNNDMIRQLVRLIGDPEPGIRTNTLICIGKLCTAKEGVLDLDAGGVNENSHRYAICPALLHALRDSFPPVRSAALAVASACANRWDAVEIARKVIPSLSPLLIDSERQVRMAALKALQAMISRVETHSQTMPATATPAKSPSAADSSNASSASAATGASSPSSSSSGRAQAVAADMAAASMAAASGWGGWAVSSLSSTFSGALSLAASSPPSTAEPTASQPLSISAPLSQPSPLSRTQSPSAVAASNNNAAAARNSPLSASPSLAKSSQTEKKPTSSGWGFNEDDDDDNGNDNDGWGIDDVDAWDNDDFVAASSAAVASNKPVAGMAMTSTLTPAPLKSSTLSLSKPAASKMLSANRTSVSASQTLTTGSRRKGLGAMKLGGGAKKPTILDDDFL